jgi:hypothetical protein
MASEEEKARLAKQRGVLAAGIKDPEKRRAFIAKQGKAEASGEDTEDLQKETDLFAAGALWRGSFKKGGKVKKTGLYTLHKGEEVTPAKRAAAHLGKEEDSEIGEVSGSSIICKLRSEELIAIGSYKIAACAFRDAGDTDTAELLEHIQSEEEHHAKELKEREDSSVQVEDVLDSSTKWDGTSGTGFVTLEESGLPRQCSRCRFYEDDNCHNPNVMADEEIPDREDRLNEDGTIHVNDTDCCNFFSTREKE